jgi:p-cymene methyl-monooxygenase
MTMLDHLKYYLSPLTQMFALWGFYLGGDWVWIGIAWFPLLALVDSLLPIDLGPRKMSNRALAYVPVWLATLLGPTMYIGLAWTLAHHELSDWQTFGAVMGTAWLSVLPLVPAAHELYHARGGFGKFVARYAQVCFLDPTRMEAHVVGHHIDVGTEVDSDTAARGETLYSFAPRAVLKSTVQAQKFLSDALEKKGYGRWSIRHGLWSAILAQVLFQTLLYVVGGWKAVALALAAMVIARFWVETFNYFQHYGQVRVVGSLIEKRHVWNHFGALSRLLGFEITNHADHHLNSYQPYYALVPHKESIRMPNVFACFLVALIPPLWFRWVIKPALKDWDLHYANAAERQLAAAQNRRAGWEDWFSDKAETNRPNTSAA